MVFFLTLDAARSGRKLDAVAFFILPAFAASAGIATVAFAMNRRSMYTQGDQLRGAVGFGFEFVGRGCAGFELELTGMEQREEMLIAEGALQSRERIHPRHSLPLGASRAAARRRRNGLLLLGGD